MAKDKSGDTGVVSDTESTLSVGLSAVSLNHYDRARAWDMYVAGALAGRLGPSTVQTAITLADQILAERDSRFPVESQS